MSAAEFFLSAACKENAMRGCWWFFLLVLLGATDFAQSQSPLAQAFRVPEGFEITQFATDSQATNIINMTVDAAGRVIVAAPGYLKALVDDNRDGVADRSVLLANAPKDGAQGLAVDGNNLFVVGDGGLWLWEGLLSAKGSTRPAKQLLKFPTGAEHGTHSIQLGPDHHWYLIAGNFAGGITNLGESSTRRNGRAGTVWRMDRTLAKRQLWSEGLRNAYDFSFTALGSIVTYDSDDERDSGLPFYRPTRIFQLNLDSDSGWVSRGWKDNDAYVTMPDVLAETGRASPTGVTCCLHPAWPESYYGAILAADWTFGRIWCLKPDPQGGWTRELLVESTGSLGFAPTDLAMAPDGSLLICSGGRGTQGAVFALRCKGERSPAPESQVEKILAAPQPYDGWSQTNWQKDLRAVGGKAVVDWLTQRVEKSEQHSLVSRIQLQRAAECLLLDDTPAPATLIQKMMESGNPDTVRAAWWFLGHRTKSIEKAEAAIWNGAIERGLFAQTKEFDPETVRVMLEAIALRSNELRRYKFSQPLKLQTDRCAQLSQSHWQLLLSVVYRFQNSPTPMIQWEDWPGGNEVLRQTALAIYAVPNRRPNAAGLELVDRQLGQWEQEKRPRSEWPQALVALAIQKFLGDWRYTIPSQKDPQNSDILDGYRGLFVNEVPAKLRDSLALKLLRWNQESSPQLSSAALQDLWRTIAMLQPTAPEVLTSCLDQFNRSPDPSDKLHYLLVASQCNSVRTAAQTTATAQAMQALVREVVSQNVSTDRNWPSRMQEIVNLLKKRDPKVLPTLLAQEEFGLPVDWVWGQSMGELSTTAREKMLQKIEQWSDRDLSMDILRYLQPVAKDPRMLKRLRRVEGRGDLETWIIEQLAAVAAPEDYSRFLVGMASRDNDLALQAWRGLKRLAIDRPKDELVPLLDLRLRMPLPNTSTTETGEMEKRIRTVLQSLKVAVPNGNFNRWPLETLITSAVGEEAAKRWKEAKKSIDWEPRLAAAEKLGGDLKRGEELYRQLRCSACHQGDSALGPALAGVSKRFSRDDLFRAIYDPNRDIPDRYRSLTIMTTDGEVLTGIPVYDSVDGVILATVSGESVRVKKDEIEQRRPAEQSLMPVGLIDALTPQQLADLQEFISRL
jgi:putative heme-binding domain-containing protein